MNLTKLLTVILSSAFLFCIVGSRGIAGNVKLVAMNGNQYWFSSSSPYAPQLNFHLAYQYCRTLGLQLMVLETREEVDTIATYLTSVEGSTVASKKYWTSGNRLGADSWIWMSSGEQLNNTFSEYWLQQKQSEIGTPKQCMSMKTTVTRRTIFSSEDCDTSLPFICEQVRCLYYNYPVTQFPDPNASAEASALRADLEESGSGSGPANSASESRIDEKLKLSADEKLRAQHFISGRHVNSLQEKVVEQDSSSEANRRNLDPNTIHRRITLRPVMTSYPPSPDYINSFYRYQSIDYSATSTIRPTFKKTTRQSLWGPQQSSTAKPQGASGEDNTSNNNEDAINNANENTQENTSSAGTTQFDNEDQLASGSSESKNIVYITSTTVLPKNSSRIGISTTSTVSREQNVPKTTSSSVSSVSSITNRLVNDPDKVRNSLEIVKSKGRGVPQQSSKEQSQQDNGRIGIGSTVPIILIKDGKEVVTDPTTIAFDDDLNNVGGEIDTTVIDTTIIDSSSPTTDVPNFSNNARSIESSVGRYGVSNSATGKTTSVMQSDIMKMYQFQRSKSPFAWSARGRSINVTSATTTTPNHSTIQNSTTKPIGGIRDRRILSNSGSSRSSETNREARQNHNFTHVRSTTIRPPKIGLAPRLKFIRNRS